MNNLTGFLALLVTAFLFALTGVFVRYFEATLSVYQLVTYRDSLVFVFALLILRITGQPLPLRAVPVGYLVGFALSYGFTFLFFNLSVLHTTFTTATFGIYLTSIILAIILGAWLFTEALRRTDWLGIGLVGVGLLAFSYPLSLGDTLGLGFFYGCITGVTLALSNMFRKRIGPQIPPFGLVLVQSVGGVTVGGVLMLIFAQPLTLPGDAFSWLALITYALINLSVAYLLVIGFKNFDLNLGSVVLSSDLIFAILLGFFVYREIPTPGQMVGSVLILMAIVVINIRFDRPPRSVRDQL